MNDDIWDSIDNVELPTGTYFGKVNFDVWYCVLRKGEGAVPFDPNQHSLEERRTQIHIMITPLTSSRAQFITERKCLAESHEWAKIILPSIKALGLKSARELEHRWVQYVMQPTGRSYTDKNGAEKQTTVPKFLAVYDSEEQAEQARNELYATAPSGQEPQPSDESENPERKVAELFLKSLVQTVGKDRDKVAALLASQPLVSKYLTVDSPEVEELLR